MPTTATKNRKKTPTRAPRRPKNPRRNGRADDAPRLAQANSILADLGLIGIDDIEPVIVAALVSGEPLLLIGPHGTGKSYLLSRICEALELRWRHYNASLLNFDDLVGYPLPADDGGLRYVQTPSSVWDAQAVFIDEISRCRPDLQNKLFPIIHERRVQGILLEDLVYRWSAMNPPDVDGDDDQESGGAGHHGYIGSEPLDPALADRFAFVVEMPDWARFTEKDQHRLILMADEPLGSDAADRLRRKIQSGRELLPLVKKQAAQKLAEYVRMVSTLLRQGRIELSGRRAAILLRNITAVHAVRLLDAPDADPGESALLALTHSLPDRAMGVKIDRVRILAAHREAWKLVALEPDNPHRFLMLEPDPLRRVLGAIAAADLIATPDFSGIVTDALNELPDGARHAVIVELFESGAAGRLVAAVADQWAAEYALVATPQEFSIAVRSKGSRHKAWQHVVARLGALPACDEDTPLATNLLAGMYAAERIVSAADVDLTLDSWQQARRLVKGGGA